MSCAASVATVYYAGFALRTFRLAMHGGNAAGDRAYLKYDPEHRPNDKQLTATTATVSSDARNDLREITYARPEIEQYEAAPADGNDILTTEE
jgi:hypothetical protein